MKDSEPRLKFPKTWFDAEVRDDFLIPRDVKHAWAAQLEVFVEIDRICKKHDIAYFADWGTLLGTIRHKGFIPWDDDMDLCMRREDFDKFAEVCRTELSDSMMYINSMNEKRIDGFLARVIAGDKIGLDSDHLHRFHGCPYAVGIDIFPLDYLPRKKEDEEFQILVFQIINNAIHILEQLETMEGEEFREYQEILVKLLGDIKNLLGADIPYDSKTRSKLYTLAERVMGMYTADECDDITSYCNYMSGWKDYRESKHIFDETLWLPFENVKMPVPSEYDKVLTMVYHDYMTPVKVWNTHDYPFFKDQREALYKKIREAAGVEDAEAWMFEYVEQYMVYAGEADA